MDYEWQSSMTEEKRLALELSRKRSDDISKRLGDYLLKGYRMLGITCGQCGTILLKDRNDVDYCVACSEIDKQQQPSQPNQTNGQLHDPSAVKIDEANGVVPSKAPEQALVQATTCSEERHNADEIAHDRYDHVRQSLHRTIDRACSTLNDEHVRSSSKDLIKAIDVIESCCNALQAVEKAKHSL